MENKLILALMELERAINDAITNGYLKVRSLMSELEKDILLFLIEQTKAISDKSDGIQVNVEGAMLNNEHNKTKVLEILSLFEKQFPIFFDKLVSSVINQMEFVTELNKRYFDTLTEGKVSIAAAIAAGKKNSLNRLGIFQANELTPFQKKGKDYVKTTTGHYVKHDSFLGKKKLLLSAKIDLANAYHNAFKEGKDFFQFRKEYLNSKIVSKWKTIKGKKHLVSGGVIDKHYQVTAWEAITGHRRTEQKEIANVLGIKYAIYQGTTRETSRPFCVGGKDIKSGKTHSGLLGIIAPINIFHEIATKSGAWSGKYPNGHDITVGCGGFRCYHYLRYISKEMYEYYLSLPTTKKIVHLPSKVETHKLNVT